MTALAEDRNTRAKHRGRSINMTMAASTQIFAGAMVASDAAGDAVPMSDTAALALMGVAEEGVDNSGGSAGDLEIRVRKGTFEFNTTGANAVVAADIGRVVYALDDNTVVKVAGVTNNRKAGTLDSIDVESGLFWVTMFDETVL